MIGIDTNILVRYFAQDDARQSATANALLNALTPDEPGFVSLVVLAELIWVLTRSYNTNREQLVVVIERLLGANEIHLGDAESVHRALAIFKKDNVDFADALIAAIARTAGCTETVTFDRAGSRVGMRLLG